MVLKRAYADFVRKFAFGTNSANGRRVGKTYIGKYLKMYYPSMWQEA
jgi:hypothetical protein